MRILKELYRSLTNSAKFWQVVWNYRWWDYGFTLDIIVRDLTIKERMWGVHTHYVGDQVTKKRIQVLLRMYERYTNATGIYEEDALLKKFLRTYARTLPILKVCCTY
jgi:hypothetical protein